MTLRITIPQGTNVSVGSGVTTYSGLLTTLEKWLNRSDLGLVIPDFITLLEDRLNRILREPEMEEVVTLSTTSATLDLPTDWRQVRNVYLDTDPRAQLAPVSLATLRTEYADQTTGKPEVYAVSGDNLILGPAPDDTYDLILTYYQEIPALSASNETNWLITKHPSIYLYGALVMAEAFIWDDERLERLWKPAWDEALGELMAQGNRKRFGAAPIRLRPSVRE
jgi:hypothetical protein